MEEGETHVAFSAPCRVHTTTCEVAGGRCRKEARPGACAGREGGVGWERLTGDVCPQGADS